MFGSTCSGGLDFSAGVVTSADSLTLSTSMGWPLEVMNASSSRNFAAISIDALSMCSNCASIVGHSLAAIDSITLNFSR